MFTADQIIAHAIGDYIAQSDWMAGEKTKRNVAAFWHVATYGLPFLFFKPSLTAYLVIVVSHFVIDRWRLARYIVWAKNHLAPKAWRYSWADCNATGYHKDRPVWLSVWLLIVADNILHVIINGIALRWLS